MTSSQWVTSGEDKKTKLCFEAIFSGGPLSGQLLGCIGFTIYRDHTGQALRGLGLKGIIGVGCEIDGIYVLGDEGYVWVWASKDGRRADEIAKAMALAKQKKQEDQGGGRDVNFSSVSK